MINPYAGYVRAGGDVVYGYSGRARFPRINRALVGVYVSI